MVYHANRYLFKLRIYAHFIGSEDIMWTEINRGNRVFDIVALIELVDRSEKCEIRTYIHAYDNKTGILCDTADYINTYSSDGMNIDYIIESAKLLPFLAVKGKRVTCADDPFVYPFVMASSALQAAACSAFFLLRPSP